MSPPIRQIFVLSAAVVLWAAAEMHGQRVQFPAAAQGSNAYPPPSTYAPGTPSVGAAPTFDPYASGASGQPSATVPYNYNPAPNNYNPTPIAPAQPAAPTSPWQPNPTQQAYPAAPAPQPYSQQPSALFPEGTGMPLDWQQGTWGLQGEDGYLVQAQRFMQELGVEYTWLYGDHSDPQDLEINRAELYSTFAIPMPYFVDTPLLVTPGFAANFLSGPIADPAAMPRGPDLPPRLYDAYLDFAWFPQFTPIIGGELGFRTGVWSDFDHVTSDSVRFLGRGLAKLSVTPQLDVLFGAVYLDRVKIKLLPAGGLYWRPTPEWDLYIVFPNPKIRKQFASVGNTTWYYYFTGEYGGGSWTVDRSGTSDRMDINDIRVAFGFEWETLTQVRGHFEAGYVWDREIVFADTPPPSTFNLNNTFMLRGGVDF